ncbi:MAG: hypothetical protein QW320_07090 [Ignisphaera sp.]
MEIKYTNRFYEPIEENSVKVVSGFEDNSNQLVDKPRYILKVFSNA